MTLFTGMVIVALLWGFGMGCLLVALVIISRREDHAARKHERALFSGSDAPVTVTHTGAG